MAVRGACKETGRIIWKHFLKRLRDHICKVVVRNLTPDTEIVLSAGLKNAARLLKRLKLVGKEHHPELARHGIEAFIFEWQRLCVSQLPFDLPVLPRTRFCVLEHR